MKEGRVVKVSGPLIIAENMAEAKMYDVVKVGEKELIGEIIELRGDKASIQVYEETSMLGVGDKVVSTQEPLSVELAPGLIGEIFDGIQRPLVKIADKYGDRITSGIKINNIDRKKRWDFTPTVKVGDIVKAGDRVGFVYETEIVKHNILIQKGFEGKIVWIQEGTYTIEQPICRVLTDEGEKDVIMLTKWPVRKGRPYNKKLTPTTPLVTGQRVIDTLFPIAKGGVASVPGPFGSGKTVVQHQLAKWADAEIVVYVGCGERGNEMTDVLNEFPELEDTKTGYPIMKRTILIANTSDMPVAAREASIYTGITIAEYYRDMGFNVALMADSTSRWAEALREMSGRLEEMPGEEGYPAYLASRLAEFYERAGIVKILGSKDFEGSITAIGAVSPQGGDLSEPVAQATLRIVKVFWGLSSALAYKRHFPAIDWLISYSLYSDRLSKWFEENIDESYPEIRNEIMKLLQQEAELQEIVKLVGADSISSKDKLILDVAKTIREDYLHQNAFHDVDTYTSLKKQFKMMKIIYENYKLSQNALENGVRYKDIVKLSIKEQIGRMKYIEEGKLNKLDKILTEQRIQFKELTKGDI